MARNCVVPTRSRIKALLVKQGLLSSYYPSKIVIAIGIASTMCGVSMIIFGVVSYLIDTAMPVYCNGIWIGFLVFAKGIISIICGNRPQSNFLLYFNLFITLLTTAITGFMSILTASIVVNDHNDLQRSSKYEHNEVYLSKVPTIMINSLLLVISSLTCVLSLLNFCISAREACQCYSYRAGILGINDPLNHLGLDTIEKRNRIISWIVEQSVSKEVTNNSSSIDIDSLGNNKKKLAPLNSTSTVSTRLSGYVS